MKLLVVLVVLAGSLCFAQVPKPPWASGGSGASKPAPKSTPPSPDRSAEDSATTIHVNVKLVNVFVTVTDKNGAPVGGYTQSGIGREESFDELLEFTQVKNVNVNLDG